jgi:hypothetical protein
LSLIRFGRGDWLTVPSVLWPESQRAHEHISFHRQFGELLAQVIDLAAHILGQQAFANLRTLIRPPGLSVRAVVHVGLAGRLRYHRGTGAV